MALAQPDPSVLRRAQHGDEHAFTELVRLYELPVFNYLLRLLGDRSLAEDLTQEVFIRVLRALPGFSGRSRFTTWLFQIAKHRALDEVRIADRRPLLVPVEDVAELVGALPEESADTIDVVWRAVRGLDVNLRMTLLLRDVVGLSYREIGDVLDIPLSTVKWRIYYARERVAAAVLAEGTVAAVG